MSPYVKNTAFFTSSAQSSIAILHRSQQRLGSVEVRYVPHADAAILTFLAGKGRGWRLATDDRALATRARHGGAETGAADAFWRKVAAAGSTGRGDESVTGGPHGGAVERLPDEPVRLPRRRRK